MESQIIASSPWLDPRFLLPAGTAIVIVIFWFARLEFKANANTTRQREYEAEMDKKVQELREIHREVKKAFYAHAADTKVHHNEEMFKEFRNGLEQRFSGFDTKLNDIVRKLERIAGK